MHCYFLGHCREKTSSRRFVPLVHFDRRKAEVRGILGILGSVEIQLLPSVLSAFPECLLVEGSTMKVQYTATFLYVTDVLLFFILHGDFQLAYPVEEVSGKGTLLLRFYIRILSSFPSMPRRSFNI